MSRRSRRLFLPLLSSDFVARNSLMSWKHSSQVLNSGEYGGWNNKRTPQFASKAVRIGFTKWPWWKPQLSIIAVSPLSSTADPSALVRLAASSKNNRSSWPLDGTSSTFILFQGIHFDDGYCHSFVILIVFAVFYFLSCRDPPWYTLIWQTSTAGPGDELLRRVTNDLAVPSRIRLVS